jgi:hypothetical protein
MKNVILRTVKALSLCALLGVPILCPQVNRTMLANVPFDFTVLDHQFSAGKYSITSKTPRYAILIRGEGEQGGGTAAFVLALPAQASKVQKEAKLVFRRYGDQFFLRQIWYPGTDEGHELRVSKVEQEVARNMPKPEQTDLLVAGSKQHKPVR